jgi:hypothetical protein
LMSMEPFSWLSDPQQPNLERKLRTENLEISEFAAKNPEEAIHEVSSRLRVKELEFDSFAGDAMYIAIEGPKESRIIPINGPAEEVLQTDVIVNAAKRAAAPFSIAAVRSVKEYEAYYVDRQDEKPLPVICIQLNDPGASTYYIDPRTGRVVQSYGSRSRWNRWLYHGLHSMDVPWLYARRPAWDIVVMAFMLGGTALSVTSILIGWKVVRRQLRGNSAASEKEDGYTETDAIQADL